MIFCLQIKVKGFFRLVLQFQLCVASHAQITQSNNFAISLQYLKKEVTDKVYFLHADKHERFLQIDTIIFDGGGSRNSKFAMSLQYLKNKLRDKNDFLHADKHQIFLQMDFNTLGIKVSYKVILS